MRNFLHRVVGQLLTFKQKPKRRRSLILSIEKKNLISSQLDKLMEEDQPYLMENYSLRDLAEKLNLQQHQLSVFLNYELGKNFNNYVNEYRVRYCKTLIQKGESRQLNAKGLASKCGFHNRNTFTSAFKKFAGCTPSDYTKRYYAGSSYQR